MNKEVNNAKNKDGLEQTMAELEGQNTLNECEEFIFFELFIQISYDLHSIYQDLGGDFEDFHYQI